MMLFVLLQTDSMFKSLILLHIGINFFEKAQRCRLSKILEFTPMLETLSDGNF
jgi:flagellar assembly factor FliW